MKLKKLFAGLLALGLCGFAVCAPVLASSNTSGRLPPLKQLKPSEPPFTSLDVDISGTNFRVILNGFEGRSEREIRRGVETYLRSWNQNLIERLSRSGVTEIFLDEYEGGLHGLISPSRGYYTEGYHGRIIRNRLILVVPEYLVFWYVR